MLYTVSLPFRVRPAVAKYGVVSSTLVLVDLILENCDIVHTARAHAPDKHIPDFTV